MNIFREAKLRDGIKQWHASKASLTARKAASRSQMIDYLEQDGTLIFNVRVVPARRAVKWLREHEGSLRVRVAAPPVNGAANDELVRLLARAFKVSRAAVAITAVQSSRLKRVAINGTEPEMLARLEKGPS